MALLMSIGILAGAAIQRMLRDCFGYGACRIAASVVHWVAMGIRTIILFVVVTFAVSACVTEPVPIAQNTGSSVGHRQAAVKRCRSAAYGIFPKRARTQVNSQRSSPQLYNCKNNSSGVPLCSIVPPVGQASVGTIYYQNEQSRRQYIAQCLARQGF